MNEGFLFVDRLVRDWTSGSNRFDLGGEQLLAHRRMRAQSRSLSRSRWDWQASAPLRQGMRTSPWRRLRAGPADARRGRQHLPNRAPQNSDHGSRRVLPAAWVRARAGRDGFHRDLRTFYQPSNAGDADDETDGAELTLYVWREFCENPLPPPISGPPIHEVIACLKVLMSSSEAPDAVP
jgi:hypothetical protein